MDNFERYLGPKPPEGVEQKIRAKVEELFGRRLIAQAALRQAQRSVSEPSLNVLRSLVESDPKLTAAAKDAAKTARARLAAHAERAPQPRTPVLPRVRLGSISATFVPPFGVWQWQGGTYGDSRRRSM